MDIKNYLQHKGYNPCGELVGNERELCDSALTGYSNLPYTQVMRNVVLANINDNSPAVDEWADRDLNEVERQIGIDFKIFSSAQIGLCKYYIHILYENRYNIFYNRLADFCAKIDNAVMSAAEERGLTPEALERKIDDIAQKGTYSMTFNELFGEVMNYIR